ncbi:hypothetical protein ERJ75_001451700 [Trypanosoma vivax]|uniref:Uncharacterized protein n=1 Tax=Trypanosoma vivax (strain Y486) TaxID=1055687 RepID=G0TW50_TRYVY|nr:hypothetical protein ERJ75_001451700 [Trypanosoma vivax]CCC48166.1 conserved hypothetical protein [Trypanosoma vivax Y486]
MTSKTPSRRLTDVLRSNSKEVLRRNAAELARASASLTPEELETRFTRNQRLISPKSLCLLYDSTTLARWCVFAVYKPPFCPMRRAESYMNYHRVSVESFVSAALRSREVYPVLARELSPQEVNVRVVHDLDTLASGPVVVTIADRHEFSRTLKDFTMRYDVLVAGHSPLTEPREVAVEQLFTPPQGSSSSVADVEGQTASAVREECSAGTSGATASASLWASCRCTVQVKRNAYYAMHPVSFLEFVITSPPTSLPPCIESYVREHMETCVLGDPEATSVVKGFFGPSKSSKGVVELRGDCDFPRVFTHLREVSIRADVADAAGGVAGEKIIDFHCRNCFEPILQRERIYSLKRRRICLLDGSWAPDVEFL